MHRLQEVIKEFGKILLKIILLYAVFIIILFMGQCVPRSYIKDNVWKSYEIMNEEGLYADGFDTFTDALFLNSAITRYQGNLIERAFSNAYTKGEDWDVLQGIPYILDVWPHSHKEATIIPYTNYWVGSLFFVKFLFLFFDIRQIRVILVLVCLILFIHVIKKIISEVGIGCGIAFFISFMSYNYIWLARGISFFFDYFVVLISCALLLRKNSKANVHKIARIFFIIGAVTSYVGYWVIPIITLVYPLAIITIKKRCKMLHIAYYASMWATGCAMTIAIKLIITKYLFGVENGTYELKNWTAFGVSEFVDRLNVVIERLEVSVLDKALSQTTIMLVACAFILLFLIFKTEDDARSMIIPEVEKNWGWKLLVISAIPLIWDFVFVKHGGHGFVTNMYGSSLFCWLSIIFSSTIHAENN